MESQKCISNMGGTMRLGEYDCILQEGSKAGQAYGKTHIKERHRHRFEFNGDYRSEFEAAGMKGVGENPIRVWSRWSKFRRSRGISACNITPNITVRF